MLTVKFQNEISSGYFTLVSGVDGLYFSEHGKVEYTNADMWIKFGQIITPHLDKYAKHEWDCITPEFAGYSVISDLLARSRYTETLADRTLVYFIRDNDWRKVYQYSSDVPNMFEQITNGWRFTVCHGHGKNGRFAVEFWIIRDNVWQQTLDAYRHDNGTGQTLSSTQFCDYYAMLRSVEEMSLRINQDNFTLQQANSKLRQQIAQLTSDKEALATSNEALRDTSRRLYDLTGTLRDELSQLNDAEQSPKVAEQSLTNVDSHFVGKIDASALKEIKDYLFTNQKINAIKVFRDAVRCELRLAKEAIDAYDSMIGNPQELRWDFDHVINVGEYKYWHLVWDFSQDDPTVKLYR